MEAEPGRVFTTEQLDGLPRGELVELVMSQESMIELLMARVERLEAESSRDLANSSRPPSADQKGRAQRAEGKPKGAGRRRGKQPGAERRVVASMSQLAAAQATRPMKQIVRRYGTPTLRDLTASGARLDLHASILLQELFPDESAASLEHLAKECSELAIELSARTANPAYAKEYPQNFALAQQAAFVLYSLIRIRTPACIIETGVANGSSSFYILRALTRNGSGILHSIDIRGNVGTLLTEEERYGWDLRLLDRSEPRKSFMSIMSRYAADVFLHDSDHSFSWQRLEYMVAIQQMGPTGLLLSDDVDSSYAFRELCESRRATPHLLLDETKVFGVLKLGSPDDDVGHAAALVSGRS